MNFKQVTSLKIPEGNVLQINSGSQILWQSKNRYDLPDGYEAVDWLMAPASVGAYIDLDLKFAIAGRAEMELYVEDKSTTAYPFGAVENSGKTRFCLSAPYNTNATFYFTKNRTHTEYSSSLALGKNDIVLAVTGGKGLLENQTLSAIYNSSVADSYTMSTNLLLFAQWYTDKVRYGGIRKIGKFKYYDKDNVLVCSLIPCYNTNSNENGMYDVVRRRFFVNVGEGAFISGKNQGSIVDGINNLVAYAKTNPQEGSETYGGDKIGYKDGMRWSSSGASEGTYGSGRLTGWIPYEHGATLRIKNMGMTVSSYVQGGYIVYYMSDGTYATQAIGQQSVDYYEKVLNKSGAKFFRISGYCLYADNSMVPMPPIVTLNQEIPF